MKSPIPILLALVMFVLLCASAPIRTQADDLMMQLPVPDSLATPAKGSLYRIPVVVVAHMPTDDGEQLNEAVTGISSSITDLENKMDAMDAQIKFSLEEGSRYHGYKDPNAKPSLGYEVIGCIAIYDLIPRSQFEIQSGKGTYTPDYAQILKRINAQDWVENQGAKEFWVWGYHHNDLAPAESNMSSPLTGDISNSEGVDDLPVYKNSYTVYNYNYQRTVAEAVHDHGHQLERLMFYIDKKQNGNSDLWGVKWMGQDGHDHPIMGRCGWTHMPPNTLKDYDYQNPVSVQSDIEDWTPERTGRTKNVNAQTWGNLPYRWPGGFDVSQKTEAQWYIYWRQNIPGLNNGISYKGGKLTNWWRFVGDWDGAVKENIGLYKPAPNS